MFIYPSGPSVGFSVPVRGLVWNLFVHGPFVFEFLVVIIRAAEGVTDFMQRHQETNG